MMSTNCPDSPDAIFISSDDEVDYQKDAQRAETASPSLLQGFNQRYVFKMKDHKTKQDSSESISNDVNQSSGFYEDPMPSRSTVYSPVKTSSVFSPSKRSTVYSPAKRSTVYSPAKRSTVYSPSKRSVRNFSSFVDEDDESNEYKQDFEMPNVSRKDKATPAPVVAATRFISGISVQLPVNPYPAQLSVMDKVIKGITHSENCLIESPTGSGKTLALLCSSLAWQKKERDRIEALIIQAAMQPDSPDKFNGKAGGDGGDVWRGDNQAASYSKQKDLEDKENVKKPIYVDDSDDDAFVEKSRNNKKNQKKNKREDSKDNEDLVTIHKKAKLSSPVKQSIIDMDQSCSPSKDEAPAIPRIPRIIFGTRTHKQIEQVIKELRRTVYSKNIKMSILSSREHTCINPLPKDYSSKTKYCKALMDKAKKMAHKAITKTSGCHYYDNKAALIGNRAPRDVWDIEDIVELGNKRDACPYFAARDLADFAHIVFCPYNYIIDPVIRSSIQMSLEGNIILIDEGHNIEDTCRETASLTVEVSIVEECIKELDDILKVPAFNTEDTDDIFVYFKRYLNNWADLFHNHIPLLQKQSSIESTYVMSGAELADSLQKHSIGYRQFDDFKVHVNAALAETKNKSEEIQKRVIPASTGTLLGSIVIIFDYFFKNGCKHLDNYNGIFTRRNERARSRLDERVSYSLKVSCMDPSLIFSEISSQARCVVLSSGTLTPVSSFSSELGTQFHHVLQARHVIKPEQVWVGTIDSGPNGVPLEATYKNTSSSSWQDSLGEVVLWVSQKVPNGVLCFLSSYRLLETLQERWESTGLWKKLQELKYVFTEGKNMNDHNQIMSDFYTCVIEGAILFAVFRGKVSEGMDFRDHQARAVITVGIPYAHVKDPMVDGKMKYNNVHQIDRKLVSGQEWYSIQAFRALNQALGRCVRHKDDWGAIIMVDSRFRKDHVKQHISKWVQTFLGNQHYDWSGFTTGQNNLEVFINKMQSLQTKLTLK